MSMAAMRKTKASPAMSSVAPAMPRTQRIGEKRRKLGELTMQLMRERGFDTLSVNELAERASMSIGGLYRYIKTKSDLLEIVCDEINMDLVDRMQQAAAAKKKNLDKLEVAFRVYWEMCWDSSAPILVAYREWQSLSESAQERYIAQERRLLDFFAALIAGGISAGEFPAIDARLLSSEMIMLAQMRAVKGWMFKGASQADVFAEHWALIHGRLRKSRTAC